MYLFFNKLSFLVVFLVGIIWQLVYRWFRLRKQPCSVAFFHPFCDDLGGGERVLWCIIKELFATQVKEEKTNEKLFNVVAIYYSAKSLHTPLECLQRVKKRFNIDLLQFFPNSTIDSNINSTIFKSERIYLKFIPINTTNLLNPKLYKRFSLMLQSLASLIVCLEALIRFTPTLFIDTTGYSFMSILVRIMTESNYSTYIHYPIISYETIHTVKKCAALHYSINFSSILIYGKLIYYQLFMYLYAWCGQFFNSCVVNSSWTFCRISSIMERDSKQHAPSAINKLLFRTNTHSLNISLVYPPCSITEFQKAAKPFALRANKILSVAQFRPEKNHIMQIDVFAELVKLFSTTSVPIPSDLELIMCGGVRNQEDQKIVNQLKKRTEDLGLTNRIQIKINPTFEEIKDLAGSSKVGFHTMVDEHFGIAVVELLAAGLIVVAHNSGGPSIDILNLSKYHLSYNLSDISPTKHDQVNGLTLPQQAVDPPEIEVEDGIVLLQTPRRFSLRQNYCIGSNNQNSKKSLSDKRDNQMETSCILASFGFLCTTTDGFAKALFTCFAPTTTEKQQIDDMLQKAKISLQRFNSDDEFGKKTLKAMRFDELMNNN